MNQRKLYVLRYDEGATEKNKTVEIPRRQYIRLGSVGRFLTPGQTHPSLLQTKQVRIE